MLYCDLHGHSRRKNVFMYGNSNSDSPDETKLFPFIMSKLCPFFSYGYSRFAVQRHKENTARITMWRELRVPNVFTLDASFCGPNTVRSTSLLISLQGEFEGQHFNADHFKSVGKYLC